MTRKPRAYLGLALTSLLALSACSGSADERRDVSSPQGDSVEKIALDLISVNSNEKFCELDKNGTGYCVQPTGGRTETIKGFVSDALRPCYTGVLTRFVGGRIVSTQQLERCERTR